MEEQPVTRAQVNRAVAWYKMNKEAIAATLPLKVPGATYKKRWPECMDRQIAQWEISKPMPLNLAVVYIYQPICVVRDALRVMRK